ncbi:MAG: DsbA family oxidoreductase [Hyphomicrobiales bacterium]|nr:DsbA family oxidoreductase [Hyphomicrobiales bacterium]
MSDKTPGGKAPQEHAHQEHPPQEHPPQEHPRQEQALHGNPLDVIVVSDAVCPWCYVGKRNLEAALASAPDIAARIDWRPFQLDASIPRGGVDRKEYYAKKFGDRVPEIQKRLDDVGASVGIPFAFDAIRISPNTLDAHRLIRWAASAGVQDKIVERLFRDFFVEGRDIGAADTLIAAARDCGMDEQLVARLLASDADAANVQGEIAEAQRLGVSGVPFFIFGGRYALSGAQPPQAIAQAMRAAIASVETSDAKA